MSDLDEMSKDELLELAQAQGISPANKNMSKDELSASIEAAEGGPPQVEQQVTTTKTKDYLNRLLTNPTPGTSQATDFLGRNVAAGDKDYLSRALV